MHAPHTIRTHTKRKHAFTYIRHTQSSIAVVSGLCIGLPFGCILLFLVVAIIVKMTRRRRAHANQSGPAIDHNDDVDSKQDALGHVNEASDVIQPDLALSMSISSAIQQHIMQKLSPTASVLPAVDVAKDVNETTTISEDPLPSETDHAGRFRSSLTLDIGLKQET
ncbi:hypothetical protein NP493_153g11035 [Ridgeia piscesae]|uniref:Uncharacterized protein n=1 Tax=Ridgeia piscesae TaxID=27915 RepID=A0AAD9P488_RIDPI|nr:hypothetical protein NP493_153g11035 [Ridgeia piscesae]